MLSDVTLYWFTCRAVGSCEGGTVQRAATLMSNVDPAFFPRLIENSSVLWRPH